MKNKTKLILILFFCITIIFAQVGEPVFFPDWWYSSPSDTDIFFYGYGESSDRELAEEIARAEAYDRLVMFINGFIRAWWANPESFVEDQDYTSQSRMSVQYNEIVGNATIRGSNFTKGATYQLQNLMYEAFYQLSLPLDILNEIMAEAVIEVEDLRRQEITESIRNAIREMVGQTIEIAILDYIEQIVEETPPLPEPKQAIEEPISPILHRTEPKPTTINIQYRAPLDRLDVSSPFGMRRHPIQGVMLNHNGIDFRATTGTPVYALQDGVVFNARNEPKGYGLVVRIRHDNGDISLYAHLTGISVLNGEKVKQGDIIGFVGSTGASTGPHLHFGYSVNNIWVNLLDKIR